MSKLCFILLGFVAACWSLDTLYITVDVANVRTSSEASSHIVSQLPYKTVCYSSTKKGKWYYIDSVQNISPYPPLTTCDGWIHESIVAKSIPESDSIEVPQSPTYIAIPDYKRYRVTGFVDSLGNYHSIEWTALIDGDSINSLKLSDISVTKTDTVNYTQKEQYRLETSRQQWYYLPTYLEMKEYPKQSCYTSFAPYQFPPDSFIARVINEEFYENFESEVLIGPCIGNVSETVKHSMLVSKEVSYAHSPGFPDVKTDSLVKVMLDSIGVPMDSAQIGSITLRKVGEGVVELFITGAPVIYNDLTSHRALFDASGNLLWPQGDNTSPISGLHEVHWFTIEGIGNYLYNVSPFITSLDFTHPHDGCRSGGKGYQLLRVGKDGFKSYYMRSEWW